MDQFQAQPWKVRILVVVAVTCLVLLFVGGPRFSQRSHEHLWGLGHVLCFAVWSALLGGWRRDWSYRRLAMIVIGLTLGGGLVIELAQTMVGRYLSLVDMFNNLLGSLLALLFFCPQRRVLPPLRRHLLQGVILLLLLPSGLPLGRVLLDEYAARRALPVLADFESPGELARWSGADMSLSEDIASHGRFALKAMLTTDRYSGVGFKYFPRDWSGYRGLSFDLYNPSAEPLRVTCRIHDRLHPASGNAYSDRFNRSYLLPPGGWTTIDIDLEQVAGAPQTRPLDLGQIAGLGLFVTQQPVGKILYLDYLRLWR
ncbi:MAG: hypothetical protein RQ754_14095 [Desulfuromonadales bacterium]|nr:hypothetical protein [Desulfuromonadales bacterium]